MSPFVHEWFDVALKGSCRTPRVKALGSFLNLSKEPVAHQNGGGDACQIGNQGTSQPMANAANAHGAKVDRQHIKGGFGATLERGGQ